MDLEIRVKQWEEERDDLIRQLRELQFSLNGDIQKKLSALLDELEAVKT